MCSRRRSRSIGCGRRAPQLLRVECDVAHDLAGATERRHRLAVDLDLQPAGIAGGQALAVAARLIENCNGA